MPSKKEGMNDSSFGLTHREEGPGRDPVLAKRKAKEGSFFVAFFILLNFTIRGRYLPPFPRSISLGKRLQGGEVRASLIAASAEQGAVETPKGN